MPGLLFREINGDDTYTQYGYDLEGNVASVRNPNGNITYYNYDPLNRLETVTQPGSIVTSYVYDSHGNRISVIDAESHITTYQYDDMGRLISITSPDTGTVTYVYDKNGNPVNKIDAKGISVDYVYDTLNRLTNVNYADSNQDIIYTYDQGTNGIGKRTGMIDESGSTILAVTVSIPIKSSVVTLSSIGKFVSCEPGIMFKFVTSGEEVSSVNV